MWKNTPISSTKYNVPRFDVIADMARNMKSCHIFYISKDDGVLYGCNDEPYVLHVMNVPDKYLPEVSFVFRLDTINFFKNNIKIRKNYVMYDSFPWALIPEEDVPYTKDYIQWRTEGGDWILVDSSTGDIKESINLYGVDTDKSVNVFKIVDMVNTFKSIKTNLGPPMIFNDLQENPIMAQVIANKASIGAKPIFLNGPNGKVYEIFVFRNLANLNKLDKIDLIVRDRLDTSSIFVGEFIIRRTKNNMSYAISKFEDHMYTQFFHLL